LVNDLEVETSGRSNENSKKAQIVRMLEEGKTINEISKELKCLYNYVWQVAKAAGYTGKKEEVVAEPEQVEAPKAKRKAAKTA
jgi:transposase-like protein